MISLSNSRTNGNTSCETHFCSYSSLTLKAGRILASLRMTQVIERPFVFCIVSASLDGIVKAWSPHMPAISKDSGDQAGDQANATDIHRISELFWYQRIQNVLGLVQRSILVTSLCLYLYGFYRALTPLVSMGPTYVHTPRQQMSAIRSSRNALKHPPNRHVGTETGLLVDPYTAFMLNCEASRPNQPQSLQPSIANVSYVISPTFDIYTPSVPTLTELGDTSGADTPPFYVKPIDQSPATKAQQSNLEA
ncbi:hypothetical protein BDQ12DRAFT_671436 [Crucibulum laeve]|uniref:Uncharacterized protein n=1 Tax=Crucibulum laeve TaxID=68775 RepID=A0A5C3LII2_9AGAR|nr:hypothetical protein BDQ12DRAFT_671436 [Crucibulum laeve]